MIVCYVQRIDVKDNVVCLAGRDISDQEEAAVVDLLASNTVSRGVVCGEIGPDKGHYHLQALWEVCASSTAAVNALIKAKVTPSLIPPPTYTLTCLFLLNCIPFCMQVWGDMKTQARGSVCVKELVGKGVHTWVAMLGYCFKDNLPGKACYAMKCML